MQLTYKGPEYKDDRNAFRRLTYKNLAGLARNPMGVRMEIAAAGHPNYFRVVEGDRADMALSGKLTPPTPRVVTADHPVNLGIASNIRRGMVVVHSPTHAKVTVLRAAIARQSGQTIHEVANHKTGKKFLAKESDLKG